MDGGAGADAGLSDGSVDMDFVVASGVVMLGGVVVHAICCVLIEETRTLAAWEAYLVNIEQVFRSQNRGADVGYEVCGSLF